ncbi:unnamed protein product [Symbiodinium natans]|uniref:tRNA (guanine(37)-N1)-methyltransferase n=1 Tax=Symbiodinium natans TaxID=878477 RepID=A0A812LQA0_9DINO|nr:unnamed protein product [Symbiodinium natans]
MEVELDRSQLEERFDVIALEVPARRTGELLKKLARDLLNMARRKNVEPVPGNAAAKLILLARTIADVSEVAESAWLESEIRAGTVKVTSFGVCLGYEHFTAEEVLRKLLPAGMEIPSSFEQAGHIAHMNLRDSQLPYKHLIGQVILDKNKSIKTVVNKTGKIETDAWQEFRTFPMEHLAGAKSTVVRLKEHQCFFEFEYRDVYWNSRLQEEHGRLIEALFMQPKNAASAKPVLADCTCGVGPFSLPIAKLVNGVVSHANDLNPASIHWLRKSVQLNKMEEHVLEIAQLPHFNESFEAPSMGSLLVIHEPGDARQFIRNLFQQRHPVTHAVFNLPAAGVELLDCFRGLDYTAAGLPTPLVCCYTFSDAAVDSSGSDGCVADLLMRLAAALGTAKESLRCADVALKGQVSLPSPQINEMVQQALGEASQGCTPVAVRLVRNVAPTRHMFCVCFRVPCKTPPGGDEGVTPAPPSEKRAKLSS